MNNELTLDYYLNGLEFASESVSILTNIMSTNDTSINGNKIALISLENIANHLNISLEEEPEKKDSESTTKDNDDPGMFKKILAGIKKIWESIVATLKKVWTTIMNFITNKKPDIETINKDLEEYKKFFSSTNKSFSKVTLDERASEPYRHLNKEIDLTFIVDNTKNNLESLKSRMEIGESYLEYLKEYLKLGKDISTDAMSSKESTDALNLLRDDYSKKIYSILDSGIFYNSSKFDSTDKDYFSGKEDNIDRVRGFNLVYKNYRQYVTVLDKSPLTIKIDKNLVKSEDNTKGSVIINDATEVLKYINSSIEANKKLEDYFNKIQDLSKKINDIKDNLVVLTTSFVNKPELENDTSGELKKKFDVLQKAPIAASTFISNLQKDIIAMQSICMYNLNVVKDIKNQISKAKE